MVANPNRPALLQLLLLFFGPLLALLFTLVPHGDGLAPAMIAYLLLSMGLAVFASAALVNTPGARVALAFALVVGMFLVHLAVGVGGCTLVLATQ